MIPISFSQAHRRAVISLLLILAGAIAFIALVFPGRVFSNSSVAINGYAWSDTAGWIDLNCANTGVCGTNNFGLTLAQDGTISGYAWADNVGWISANTADLAGCPSAPCSAKITSGAVSGWLKAIASSNAQAGGWDGFISLSGAGYGVSLSNGAFLGYAWGDTNVGWVDFSRATTTFGTCTAAYTCSGLTIVYTDNTCITSNITTCVAPAFCSAGSSVCQLPQPSAVASSTDPTLTGHLQAKPTIVGKGKTTKIYWNYLNVASCTVTGTNGDGSGGTWSGASGIKVTGAITGRTTYTLSCTSLNSTQFSESASVSILPTYQEK